MGEVKTSNDVNLRSPSLTVWGLVWAVLALLTMSLLRCPTNTAHAWPPRKHERICPQQ